MSLLARKRRIRRLPKGRRIDVRREELNRLIDLLNENGEAIREVRARVEQQSRTLEIQFTRIAQIQADLDHLKKSRRR